MNVTRKIERAGMITAGIGRVHHHLRNAFCIMASLAIVQP